MLRFHLIANLARNFHHCVVLLFYFFLFIQCSREKEGDCEGKEKERKWKMSTRYRISADLRL